MVTLKAVARQNRRGHWRGGIIAHKGHPFIVDCGCNHETRQEAIDCAATAFHADPGSLTAETLEKARHNLIPV